MNKLLLAPVLFLLPLLAACATSGSADATTANDQAITEDTGVTVHASWQLAVTGTPTYGYDATEPFVDVAIEVDDQAIRAAHPGFDGLERAFVVIPFANGPQRLELPYRGHTVTGYIELRPIDQYALDARKVSADDLTAIRAEGVTIELETNVGTLGYGTSPVTPKTP